VPAHTAIAYMMNVDPAVIDALRNRTELPTDKLQALHLTTAALIATLLSPAITFSQQGNTMTEDEQAALATITSSILRSGVSY